MVSVNDKNKQQNWRLKLNENENIYECPDFILSVVKNLSKNDISKFPNQSEVINKISQKYELKSDCIFLSTSEYSSLKIIQGALLDTQEHILTYNSAHCLKSKITKDKIKPIQYKNKFYFDKDEIIENIDTQTKIIYISTPDNETAEGIKASIIETLIQKYQDIIFIIDCSYINFCTQNTFEDYIDLVKKYDNVVIIKSFSYDFALAGLGFCVNFANENLIEKINKISKNELNTVSLKCAEIVINEEKRLEEIKELNSVVCAFLSEELQKLGYKPYKSNANFILCDFNSHCDFYYEKLKKNGILTKKYSKNSPYKNCLRITLPTMGGAKYILEILNKKDLIVFNIDGVILNIKNSYLEAIKKTYFHFSNKEIETNKIIEMKNKSSIGCNWDIVKNLLENDNIEIEINEIIKTFQDILHNNLIDEEKLIISQKTFEKLSEKYDFAIYTGRLNDEAKYSLEKFEIDNLFYYFITCDDLPKNLLKPNPKGLELIKEKCPNKSIKFLASSVDDAIAGNLSQIETIGVIPPEYDNNIMVNNYRHLGINYILNNPENIESFIEEIEQIKN